MGIPTRQSEPPRDASPYPSDDELLEGARQMFRARRAFFEKEREGDEGLEDARRLDRAWTRVWHASFDRTGDGVLVRARCERLRLNRIEKEILAALVLNQLGLLEGELHSCRDVLSLLAVKGKKVLAALRALSEEGRLHKRNLLFYADRDEPLRDRQVIADPALVEGILYNKGGASTGWPVRTETELHRKMASLTRAFMKKADAVEGAERGYSDLTWLFRSARAVSHLLEGLEETLAAHPGWMITQFLRSDPGWADHEVRILLILLGKELGHIDADDTLFTGMGLARGVTEDIDHVQEFLGALSPDGALVTRECVRPCGGADVLLSDDAPSLAKAEYELTEKSLCALGIEKSVLKRRSGAAQVRPAKVRMDQLILADPVRRALRMAVAQARHTKTLVETWGLGEAVAYGRCVTLLFSGPPGVGKTACAEAFAHALEKPILVANYAEIQNCFVGMTEKNIVRTFRTAAVQDAVLFWDEADAMFTDRDASFHSWEVRDVNVLLQEVEKFEGVCILATNRKITLDRALERRISLKVEFQVPDRAMRRRIWACLVPGKMPLAPDVDFDALAEAPLTGGEIKNAVLNAARIALCRCEEGPVTQDDFREAVDLETKGKWSAGRAGRIGFGNEIG
jgi:hypothetical protein